MADHTIVTLKKGEGRTIKAGGAWVFDNEIDTIVGSFKNGGIVTVHDFDGYPMGKGYINQNSKIRVRMMTRRKDQEIDAAFLRNRVAAAWDYRKNVMDGGMKWDLLSEEEKILLAPGIGTTGRPDLNCCRVIFGEADFLPGITIDKYQQVLVVESLTLGMENFKEEIVADLIAEMAADGIHIRGVYERSDAKEREKEGLSRKKGVLIPGQAAWKAAAETSMAKNSTEENDSTKNKSAEDSVSEGTEAENEQMGFAIPAIETDESFYRDIEIMENGVHYTVDVIDGQKTGFFLDQKYNRLAIQRLCKGKKVLDCFTHMGTFALNAGIAGASDVTGLDISEFAVEQATANAVRNHLDGTVKFRCANVLDELPKLAAAGEKYDVVILDPPAFTKSREATKNAIKGYREINMKGLKLVEDGGYLATCSCSHFMTEELLKKTVKEAAKAVHKRLRQIEFRTQGPDHPILWAADESYYLKFLVFQVVDEK